MHHHKQVLCRFEPSSPFYGRFSVQKRPFLGCFRDDCPENSGQSPVCQVGVCNEGRCSSMAIGLSKDGKWVFNTACTMMPHGGDFGGENEPFLICVSGRSS